MDQEQRRRELQELLVEILGSNNVYFQPPENVKMEYPCIRYQMDDYLPKWADNGVHALDRRYQLTIIDADPDSCLPQKVAFLPKCVYDRFYVASNLNHHVFRLFF